MIALAYQSVGNYEHASDCFCSDLPVQWNYNNQGIAMRFVRDAILAKLNAENIGVDAHSLKNLDDLL